MVVVPATLVVAVLVGSVAPVVLVVPVVSLAAAEPVVLLGPAVDVWSAGAAAPELVSWA